MDMEVVWEGVTPKFGSTVFKVCRRKRFDDDEYDLSFYCKMTDDFGTEYWQTLYTGDESDENYIKYLKYYLVSVVLPIARETV